jgi:hypothetical protein
MNVLTFPIHEGLRSAWPTPSDQIEERLRVVPCRAARAEILPTPGVFDLALPALQRLTATLEAWRTELLLEAEKEVLDAKAEERRVRSWCSVAIHEASVLMGMFLYDPEDLVQALFAEQQVAPQLPWKFKDETEAQAVKKYTKSAASRYRDLEGRVLGHRDGQSLTTLRSGQIDGLISSQGIVRHTKKKGQIRHYFVMKSKAARTWTEADLLVRDLSFYASVLGRLLYAMEEERKEISDGERRTQARALICQRYRSLIAEADSLRVQMKLRREAITHPLLTSWGAAYLRVDGEQRDRKQAKGCRATLGSKWYAQRPAVKGLNVKDRTIPSAIEFVRNGTICLVRTGNVHVRGLTLWIELI